MQQSERKPGMNPKMTENNERMIERALNCSTACLLPSILLNLDMQPIARQDFDEFRLVLDDQLHLLLDILYQNGNFLRDQAFDNQLVQLRVNLLLLSCEQTAENSFFQTDQKILVTSLAKIIDENFANFDDSVLQKVVAKYKEGLKKDSWKKQLGMVHGFPKFCELVMKHRGKFVDVDLMLFMLSVGANLLSHFDSHYKTIGLKIYRNIVERGDKKLLKDLNIHQVIYSESFPMLQKSSELDYNEHLYECLIHAVAIEDSVVKDTNWCKFDDVFGELLTQIGMEGNIEVFCLLLKKIVKMCGIIYETEVDCEGGEDFEDLKAKTRSVNCRTLRWIKKLMQMIVRESSKLLIDSTETLTILAGFHAIYIVSISNTEPSVLGQQLIDFTKKLILILMQVAGTFKDNDQVIASIIHFLKTIAQHQQQNEGLVSCINKILEQIK